MKIILSVSRLMLCFVLMCLQTSTHKIRFYSPAAAANGYFSFHFFFVFGASFYVRRCRLLCCGRSLLRWDYYNGHQLTKQRNVNLRLKVYIDDDFFLILSLVFLLYRTRKTIRSPSLSLFVLKKKLLLCVSFALHPSNDDETMRCLEQCRMKR